MFNEYYEDKPVGFDSISEQKAAMGYKDDTVIVEGIGVTGKNQFQAMGFAEYDSSKADYKKNDIVTYEGELYAIKNDFTEASEWNPENVEKQTIGDLKGNLE